MAITLNPIGIPSSEAIGTPVVFVQVKSEFDEMLEGDLEGTFYNTEEFARVILYEFADGTQQSLQVIFDEEGSSIDIDVEAPVMVLEPMFHCNSNDFNKVPGKGDRCMVGNRWFYIKESHPDGTGVTVVTLRRD
jgi:hypothetical protein